MRLILDYNLQKIERGWEKEVGPGRLHRRILRSFHATRNKLDIGLTFWAYIYSCGRSIGPIMATSNSC